jgi:undecaprenyl-phosphate 4-deoxy-4-formamido-L-arabinose transferase
MNAFIVREIIRYTGPLPYIDGLILRATRNIGSVQTAHAARTDGSSNYSFARLILLWMNMFANFSIMPLRAAAILGIVVACCSLIYGGVTIWDKITNPMLPLGWASLTFLVVFLSGIQLAVLGIIGEYVGRILLHQNRTPQYIVREIWDSAGFRFSDAHHAEHR